MSKWPCAQEKASVSLTCQFLTHAKLEIKTRKNVLTRKFQEHSEIVHASEANNNFKIACTTILKHSNWNIFLDRGGGGVAGHAQK